MPPLTEPDIRDALRDCYDPAIPCNIVDLGLVRKIHVAADPNAPGTGIAGVPQKCQVTVDLIVTTDAADSAQQHLPAQIANRLAGLETVHHTVVHLLDQPLWTPSLITPAGRRALGLDGNPQLVQIAPRPQE